LNKIKLIIAREYLTRVKKTSFIVMTLLGPLLMAGLMIVPIWLATKDKDLQRIEVIDATGLFIKMFDNTSELQFADGFRSIEKAKADLYEGDFTAILHIESVKKGSDVTMFYKKQPGISTIAKIERTIENVIRSAEMQRQFKVTKEQISDIQPNITVKPISIDAEGEEESKNVAIMTGIGFFAAILIYFFIFMYGIQIMRGVIEEKTSRIVEIIISSVKPFELMMGKILGIALVGLTQFLLWSILTGAIYSVIMSVFGVDASAMTQSADMMKEAGMPDISNPLQLLSEGLQSLPIFQIFISFLFYFIGGYLLYGALLAAIGSAVDSEADTQQFMLPITIPLIFSFVVAQTVVENPDGPMAFWLSLCPLTSPIIMMVRIPFGGVAPWELILSMVLLILGFLGATWMAAKIYRTGILMYGKKVTYKELWKWLFYKG
jgi:ABC-2 type transport system permease protein